MAYLSKKMEDELTKILNGKNEAMFISNGKLISIEAEEHPSISKTNDKEKLAEQIESYPQLKESLSRYMDNPEMKKYSKEELLKIRDAKRKNV